MNFNNGYGEGNYWSDYNGLDDGSDGRIKGDGIGDTDLPHNDVDFYPFIKPYGWILSKKIILIDPGNIDSDGNYIISWLNKSDFDGYILEEDIDINFNSPTVIFNGKWLQSEIKNKSEGQYYYRVKGYYKDYEGEWSNVVNITVNWPPTQPQNLTIINCTSNSITISWDPNPESDILGYIVFRSLEPDMSYVQINSNPIKTNQFIDKSIAENTIYYFKIKAVDELGFKSPFSSIVFGMTLLGPHAPEINNSISDIEILEDHNDNISINLYYWFKDINNDPLTFWCEGNIHIKVTIDHSSGYVLLVPEGDWSGQETLTFFASDGIWNVSDNVTITVIPVNDPPGEVKILTTKNNQIVNNSTPIVLSAACFDPDLPYGDNLTFTWSSNLSGIIGVGNNLTDVYLEVGFHNITVQVTDLANLSSINWVNIIVLPADEPGINGSDNDNSDEKDDDKIKIGLAEQMIIYFIIVALVLIILIFIFNKKQQDRLRNKNEKELSKTTKTFDRQVVRSEDKVITEK